MSLTVWTQASGYVFTDNNGQPFQEQLQVDIPLPVTNDSGVSYSVISGNLPGGLSIVGNRIKGSPYIISNLISYKFCIRATKGSTFADRTFSMVVDGANPPEFITSAGALAVGIHRQLYALDGTYVTYQIEAFDLDVAIGQNLKYFIASGDGQLPPGLTLSDTGEISGYIIPANILVPEDGTGQYDVSYYDKGGFDFGLVPTDGFDTYDYEYVPFDYNSPSVLPKSLNANYQFKVTVSDGTNLAQRIFKIFIVGSDEFRADSTSRDGFAGQFTSDSTFLRNPVWITGSNLGVYRANNYLTVPIALYDSSNVLFRLETTNCEVYAVTKRIGLFDNVAGHPYLTVTNVKTAPTKGQYLTFEYYVDHATDRTYQVSDVAPLAGGYYRLTLSSNLLINVPDFKPFFIGSLSKLPPGVEFDVNSGDIFGRIPYQPAITQKFTFTVTATRLGTKATEKVDSNKTFSISILGSISSQIEWNSPSNLGSLPAAYISNLSINATSNVPGALVLYTKTSGTLPPGLSLSTDGEIVGVVNQFYNATTGQLGITRFFEGPPPPPLPPTFDGRGHHPTFLLRNAAGTPMARHPVNNFSDGVWAMPTGLPNPRTISNIVVAGHGTDADPNGYSGMLYAWGQFLTHDLSFERPGNISIGVVVPAGDTSLTPGSTIPVNRVAIASGTGTAGIPALPINDVTGWIDASVVYGVAYPPGVAQGPTPFANPVNLREGGRQATTGKLLTSAGGLYPPESGGSFVLGDPRGTENPDLTSMHTLFIREHNWQVDRLAELHPEWTGEDLYQRARSIVIAEIQKITYDEWLPKIIGTTAIPAYTGFDPAIDGSVKIEFAAAALRFGHSIVSNALDRIDELGNITESLTLAQAFFLTPAEFERNGGADGFIRKLVSDISNKLDVHIVDDLRNLLDDPPAALDLAATNIQRGRDLGLPSLNQMRTILGLTPYTSFTQITSNTETSTALQTAYTDINKIDLWIGGLSEDPVSGAMVGPTFRAILADQFKRTRDGDNAYWRNKTWSVEELAMLNNTTLAGLILRNTNTVKIQQDAFTAVERVDLYSGIVPSTDPIVIPDISPAEINFDVTFDRGNTTFDRTYKFTVEAYDQYQYSASPRDFTITVTTPNTVPYSNITARPFLAPTQRAAWQGFINDATIFTPSSIYRISDPSFGVQSSLSMLVYAGIESTDAAAYVGAMGLNVKRKRFKFGELKSATAVDANGNDLYEIIYIQMIDPADSNGVHAPLSIKTASVEPKTITVDESTGFWSNTLDNLNLDAPISVRPDPIITVDSTGYEASNPNTNTYFPNNISNWQDRLKNVGLTERNYLPLWMRSIPLGAKEQLGYVLCMPLCFCKPGTASTILLNIKYSGFDFKTIDYTVDRFTISAITGDTTDKYLVFRNDRITV